MKKKFKKLLSTVLVTALTACTVFAFDFDAAAITSYGETVASECAADEFAVAAEYEDAITVDVLYTGEENPVVNENNEPTVTDPAEEPEEEYSKDFAQEPVEEPAQETTEPTEEPAQETTEPTEKPTEPTTAVPTTVAPTTAAPTAKPVPTTKPAPKVGKVKNITKTTAATNKITLKWDKVNGASGYVIYYCNADKTTKYTKLKEVTATSVTVSGLVANTPYYFKIAAFVTQDGKKYEGTATLKRTATQPPAVQNLTLKDSSSSISFSWSKVTNATGYKIYRSCAATGGKYVLYKTIKDASTTSFTDKSVTKGKAYYYQVQAYRTYSATKVTYHSTKPIVRAFCGLGSTSVTMTSQLWRVSLSWTSVKYAGGYDIYYSTSKTGTYTKLASTQNTFYNTKKLTSGKAYYFKVIPYKIVGNAKIKVYGTYSIVSKKVTSLGYGNKVGNTYIEISLKQQHMWMYVDGKLYVETDVVTGNDDGVHNTPKGAHKIIQRQSPATLYGPGYACSVSYWLAFTYSGCGIHDSSWRSSSEYGGTTYKGNGSHGCVNTPYDKVKKIYSKAKIGTYVVIY